MTKRWSYLATAFCLCISYSVYADDSRIIVSHGKCRLSLSQEAQNALKTFNNDFFIWDKIDYKDRVTVIPYECDSNNLPYAVLADFNGDGIADIVLDGHDMHHTFKIALLSNGSAFQVLNLKQSKYLANPEKENVWEENHTVHRGKITLSSDGPEILLKYDGFVSSDEAGRTTLYFYDNETKVFRTADMEN